MKKSIKITVGIIIGVFIIMQFFTIDKSAPEFDSQATFEQVEQAPPHIVALLKNACYDCHSYETKYPWYSNVAPGSWLIQDHILEGREHLNFSVWGTYPADEKAEMREEAAEEILENKMPLKGYVLMHPEAKMTKEEKTQLADWLEGKAYNNDLTRTTRKYHEEDEGDD